MEKVEELWLPLIMAGGICMQLSSLVLSQLNPDPQGFLTIDCGLPTGVTWKGNQTGLTYISDNEYVESGDIYNVSAEINRTVARQFQTVRSFKKGINNCYTLPELVEGQKYLVRASFLYGNYDNLNSIRDGNSISFDIYLGSQFWESINITDPISVYTVEVLTIASTSYISVCLRNKNSGFPFISLLELRHLNSLLYQPYLDSNTTMSLIVRNRYNMGGNSITRYPQDKYDRIWYPLVLEGCTNISTNLTIQEFEGDYSEVPMAVLQTAVTPVSSKSLNFLGSGADYYVMSFTEFKSTKNNFSIYMNGQYFDGPLLAPYLERDNLFTKRLAKQNTYNFSFIPLTATGPRPVLNSLETFAIMTMTDAPNGPTDKQDVSAIMAIKKRYQIKKNWTGDPCSPKYLIWEGLVCSRNAFASPHILKLNLSSSGLNGEIEISFSNLTSVDSLDLSFNNITGSIPDFFADMPSLRFLNLSGNKLSGTMPPALLQKAKNNLLVLSFDGNPDLITDSTVPKNKMNKNKLALIIGICASIALLLLLATTVVIIKKLGSRVQDPAKQYTQKNKNILDTEGNILQIDSQHFTYKDLEKITNKFEEEIGKGGFGSVYRGQLFDDTKVAVKVLDRSSPQGNKEFLAEVQHLSRVHHRNLVSLIGYCKDGDHMALVYEHMSRGNLQTYIRGKAEGSKVLSWEERLQILLRASQGIEYLHCACNPPIIHRDVKPGNILLNEMLEAKIADFGLSKAFKNNCTHISTVVAGTPGYLDPEYHFSYQLNEKSDVYSFGVVLLEVLTAQPPVLENPETIHISVWVEQQLSKGSMDDVIDVKILDSYEVTSAWKIVDLAMKCLARTSAQRPIMSYVVSELKESLDLVLELKNRRRSEIGPSSSSRRIAFKMSKSADSLLLDGPSVR